MGQRNVWRGAGVALVLAIASSACQDGYPIPATLCDEWCEAARERNCGNYDPAACVLGCESQKISATDCAAEFEQDLICLRKPNRNFNCSYFGGSSDCVDTQQDLLTCAYNAQHGLLGSDGGVGF